MRGAFLVLAPLTLWLAASPTWAAISRPDAFFRATSALVADASNDGPMRKLLADEVSFRIIGGVSKTDVPKNYFGYMFGAWTVGVSRITAWNCHSTSTSEDCEVAVLSRPERKGAESKNQSCHMIIEYVAEKVRVVNVGGCKDAAQVMAGANGKGAS